MAQDFDPVRPTVSGGEDLAGRESAGPRADLPDVDPDATEPSDVDLSDVDLSDADECASETWDLSRSNVEDFGADGRIRRRGMSMRRRIRRWLVRRRRRM